MIHCWFSCGCASAVASKLIIDSGQDCKIIYNPVREEHQDNLRFLQDCEKWFGKEILIAANPGYPNCSAEQIWKEKKCMSMPKYAPCTDLLKKRARKAFESEHGHGTICLGFTADEKKRALRFSREYEDSVFPLIEKNLTKDDCFRIIREAGIEPPEIYKIGFPNANCIGCVKASSCTYWNLVRKQFPEVFKKRCELSRQLGCKLVWYKKKRIFLDELPEDAVGRKLKTMKIDCGLFCQY